MSYFDLAKSAFSGAQSTLAQLSGMEAGAPGNFLGPDGQPYVMTFRPADAYEVEAVGREMTLHGYTDKSVVIATATRSQFAAPPLDWRAKHGTRLSPAPALDCLISKLSIDDPHHFVFVLLCRQSKST